MNNPSPIVDLFVKHLQDRCTADEVKQLLKHFEIEENEEILRHLIRAELDFTHQGEITNSKEDAALLKVKSALISKIKQNQEQPRVKRLSPISRWVSRCAVWLVLVCSTALLVDHFYTDIKDYFHPVKLLTATTKRGERKLLTLSDGTKIWLSPSSSLEYPDQLIGNLREVKLEGEAFFEVAKDKKHPFIIHSGRMDTRVVGTSFNIQSFKAQINSTVTVVTGIVKVSALRSSGRKPQEVILNPNQRSQLDSQSGTLTSINYPNAKQMLKRKDGILNYDGTPVQDVVADFSRYYKVPILIESKSKNCLCYGEFDTNRPVNILLEQLAAAINAKIIIQKEKYILKGGCEE
ncbi:FecR domain-containing protein [Mucilaginibacter sp. 10I4]|uniref:FecR family protein n=1 Tax=Mucilaginibacter sp. 10I4 TaxID=3048580 RepID=UPI002B231BC0|nr:FecR domain-containing protein [Mucilaginibacter sp. 10I4]MEB0261817.1 FecR domain-containing protein [Mucilaginibacter sp. 10I4]